MVDAINRISNIQVRGGGARMKQGPNGISILLPKQTSTATITTNGQMYIAKVSAAETGGGYYDCYLQTFDATDWNTTTAGQTDNTGSLVVVLNLAEIPITGATSDHNLSSGDYMICWKFTDDESNIRYIGFGVGRIASMQAEYQVDTTNSKLQVKYRKALVLADEDASWTDVHTGDTC